LSLFSCNKENEGILISHIDIEGMRKKNLKDFEIIRVEEYDSSRTEYVFSRNNDKTIIHLNIRLYESSEIVEATVIDILNSISMVVKSGESQEIIIGDKYWWWAPDNDFNNATSLMFIRKNSFISISSYDNVDVKNLAKKIDNDILNKESYITFKN
jgi:hypothetical protein